jgi:hypothetical protein
MFAAVNKVPAEAGVAAFQRFNVDACNVILHSNDGQTTLRVLCHSCNAFIGNLSQMLPPLGCASGEVVRVNSLALHFVDAVPTSALDQNYFNTTRAAISSDDDNNSCDEFDLDPLDAPPKKPVVKKRQVFVGASGGALTSTKKDPSPPNISSNDRHTLAHTSLCDHSDEEKTEEDDSDASYSSDSQ